MSAPAPAGHWRGTDGALRDPLLAFVERRDDPLVARQKPVPGVHVGEHIELAIADRAHHALAHHVRLQPGVELALEWIIARLSYGPPKRAGRFSPERIDARLHGRGRQHRHADRRVLQVMGDRLRQRHHGELHRAVGAAAPVPADLEARDRGRIDDVALAAVLADQRQEDLQPVHHAVKVHPDVPLPLLRRQLGDRAAVDRDAGIVAGDVQRAELP